MSYLYDVRRSMTEEHVRKGETNISIALGTIDIRQSQVAEILSTIYDMIDDDNFSVDQICASIAAARALLSTSAEAFDAVYEFCMAAEKAGKAGQ